MKQKNLMLMLESHIDKIVLTIFVIISLALLWVYVIGNPYGKEVRLAGIEKKLSPSQIDRNICEELEDAIPRLNDPAQQLTPLPSLWPEYDRLVQCPISDISTDLQIPAPGEGEEPVLADRTYVLPNIPPLMDVSIESLRGAAKVPTEEIGPDRLYESAGGEVADVDLVSVSARFDVPRLVNNFQQSFMGPRLTSSEKDPRLAEPVFARLELQRRAKQRNGDWGPWEIVPRTQIDAYQKLLEELPEQLQQSEFGVDLLISQYKNQKVQHDILQPEPYSFSISRTDWMAPEFLVQALDILDKEEDQARRDSLEERRRQRENQDNNRRGNERRPAANRRNMNTGRTRENERATRPGPVGYDDGQIGRPVRPVRRETTVDDVQKEFEAEMLKETQNVTSIQDPLLVWAHDDTVQPGNVYQYRVRIGVFNPIAGKDWFQEDQAEYKDQVILWSSYSEPTDPIDIPQRIYMFPMETITADSGNNEPTGVRVEVTKYFLGQWRDYDFDVFPGQIIGYEVEDVDGDETNVAMVDDFQMGREGMMGMAQDPKLVDFTTGYMLVDIYDETVWGGSGLRPSSLETVLFLDTDNRFEQMAVGKSNWTSNARSNYDMIQNAMESEVQRRDSGLIMPAGEMMPDDPRRMMMRTGGM